MEEELVQYRSYSLALCEKLLADMKRNREDADLFLGGAIHKAYLTATEKAIRKVQKVQNNIRAL